jgi:carboxypeptidase family protein/TonB-dependent receptor-like protein
MSTCRSRSLIVLALALFLASLGNAQTVTATLSGRVSDSSGAVLPKAAVKAVNRATGITRTAVSSASGDYQISLLPVGDYTVTSELTGFKKEVKSVTLQVGSNASVDFTLAVGTVTTDVEVQAVSEAVEPTRSMVSQVIDQQKITELPVNGRQFIDFALLAPGITVGDTTSGSTDVIIEPVTKLSFAGQNIHYNFIAIDGADNMSTASGIQKTTPSQEAVREFRVINTDFSAEAGRAVGGIVNIITKSGTNKFHGSLYEYFRNDAMDAQSILTSPDLPTCAVPGNSASGGCKFLKKLHQNQFGGTIGGPIVKDKTFFFANYEGQRRSESPFYNSAILANIGLINQVKCTNFGTLACGAPGTLPIEDLNVNRTTDYDNLLIKLDHLINSKNYLTARYFFNDERLTNVSPLNDGFDLPSGFKQNNFRDQSLAGSLSTTFSDTLTNELRMQYAHRFFDFPTQTTQPHLEVSNIFTIGVNRGNPDFYEEGRFELVDNVTKAIGKHTLSFGGDFNHVNTTESFPLFYPFEADFGCITPTPSCPFALSTGSPFVVFFERFQASSNYTEPSLDPAVYQGSKISSAVRDQAKGEVPHTYNGFFIQDKWRATDRLTVSLGLRYDFETWPNQLLNNDLNNFDPRFGFAYNFGTKWNLVARGGAGIFHGTIPSPLLMCQIPSCGGTIGPMPGRENIEDSQNAATRLFAFASGPFITNLAVANLLNNGSYPDAVPFGCPSGFLATCGFFGDSVIARFDKNHQTPYGIQISAGIEMQPVRDTVLNISYLRTRGVHLGSFFNINQPAPTCQLMLHDSHGNVGPKDDYHVPACGTGPFPGTVLPDVAVYFEATSKWDSVYDGMLVNFNKRPSHHFGMGINYTWSKSIDNGPNPSFVLIPQDSLHFERERAVSADDVRNRFVANGTLYGPTKKHFIVNDFELSTIISLESPHYFTKFAGFDANGDVFGNNDRVGIEPRNTFRGDSYKSVDLRLSRTFKLHERAQLQGLIEAFNVLNTVNVRFFNTAYGAADFCPIGGVAVCGPGPYFKEGSPNPTYGTPRAVFNPRQLQLALRLTF